MTLSGERSIATAARPARQRFWRAIAILGEYKYPGDAALLGAGCQESRHSAPSD
jgi:hypothetical protein